MSLNSSYWDGPVVQNAAGRRQPMTPRVKSRPRVSFDLDRLLEPQQTTSAAGPPPAVYTAPAFHELQQSPAMA